MKYSVFLFCYPDSQLAEMKQTLNTDIHQLKQLSVNSKSSETLLALNSQLNSRKNQLLSELNYIYPITEVNNKIKVHETLLNCCHMKNAIILNFPIHPHGCVE